MKRLFRAAAVLLAAFALSSCFERTQTGMINPDGTGKMVIDTYLAAPDPAAPATKAQAAEMAKEFATRLIDKTTGVDAWADLKIETTADNLAHVAATAYFPDVSKFRLEGASSMQWKRGASGNFTLTLARQEPATAPAVQMTDELVAAKIKLARAMYQNDLAFSRQVLAKMKVEIKLALPGPVLETNLFSKDGENDVALSIEGPKVLEAMDKIMADDKAMAQSFRSGKDVNTDDDLMLEKLFGKKGPASVTVAGPGKPLFDYQVEMKAARAAQDDMLKKAGIAVPQSLQGTSGRAR